MISKQLLKIANEVNMLDDENLYKDILQLLKGKMLNDIQCPNINGLRIKEHHSAISVQTVTYWVNLGYYYNEQAQPTCPVIKVAINIHGFNNKLFYQADINYINFPQVDKVKDYGQVVRTKDLYRQYVDKDDDVQNCIRLVIKKINQYLKFHSVLSGLKLASPFKDRSIPYNSYREE